jgi:hypothetical protein
MLLDGPLQNSYKNQSKKTGKNRANMFLCFIVITIYSKNCDSWWSDMIFLIMQFILRFIYA